jgi:predicted transcriptional regulator
MKPTNKEVNVREIRRKLGFNQQQFWTKIGVTQSGGSRSDSGRNMQIDLDKIKREDLEIVELLKSGHSDLYKSLKKAVKSNKKA